MADLVVRGARCDACGREADTLHFVGAVLCYPREDCEVLCYFACPRHDFGGYVVELRLWNSPREAFAAHVGAKRWGLAALIALDERLAGRMPPLRRVQVLDAEAVA